MQFLQNNFEQLSTTYDKLLSKKLDYPSYYLKPFHAYDEGNLSWQAAMEVESAALSVHCQIYTESPEDVDVRGDYLLRHNFHTNMKSIFQEVNNFSPKKILDIGCSTGLSTVKLHESFPDAEVFGLDLSPYMLSGNFILSI